MTRRGVCECVNVCMCVCVCESVETWAECDKLLMRFCRVALRDWRAFGKLNIHKIVPFSAAVVLNVSIFAHSKILRKCATHAKGIEINILSQFQWRYPADPPRLLVQLFSCISVFLSRSLNYALPRPQTKSISACNSALIWCLLWIVNMMYVWCRYTYRKNKWNLQVQMQNTTTNAIISAQLKSLK